MYIEVKHNDVKGVIFYVSSIKINSNYKIYTQISQEFQEALFFNNKEQALNALKLVKMDMTAKNGYSVKVKKIEIFI